MFVLQDWKSAPYFSHLGQFQVVKTHPKGLRIFSCPADAHTPLKPYLMPVQKVSLGVFSLMFCCQQVQAHAGYTKPC